MRLVRRLKASPSMVIACLALLVALTGTSVAAVSQLPRGSVGTPQLKNGAVSTVKLKNNAVTTKKVKNKTLTRADFKNGTLLRGPRGLRGATGAAGAAGAAGATGPAGAPNPNAANSELLDGLDSTNFVRKTDILSVPGVEFHARDEAVHQTDVCVPVGVTATAGAVLFAGVHLPTGVTVTQVTFNWWDADAATNANVTLGRVPQPQTSASSTLSSVSSSGSPGHSNSVDSTIDNAVINNDTHSYFLQATLPGGGNMCVGSVEIAYTG